MKGAFEMMGLFCFGIMFISLLAYGGINLAIYQQARCYQEMIVAVIEHNYGYNDEAMMQLESSTKICSLCNYSISDSEQGSFKYRIEVSYPIVFPVIEYQSHLKLVTYALSKDEME